jgi:hypothetical protein
VIIVGTDSADASDGFAAASGDCGAFSRPLWHQRRKGGDPGSGRERGTPSTRTGSRGSLKLHVKLDEWPTGIG